MALTDFGIISTRPDFIRRCTELCAEFSFSHRIWSNAVDLAEKPEECRFIVADASAGTDKTLAAELAQAAKFACPQAYVTCIVSKKLEKETAVFLKKSGANAVFVEDEFFSTSKLELAATQTIKSDYLAIKAVDLSPERELYFDLFHFLPLRAKFLRCASEGDVLTKTKLEKLVSVGEIYIKKATADSFARYARDNPDLSAQGLARRCRAQYLALYASYMDLAFLLTDQSEHASYAKGEELLNHIRSLSKDLLVALGSLGDAWGVINNTSLGEAGSCERAPAVAAYVGLYGLLLGMDEVEDAMLGALLADLGLLLLPPDVTKIIRSGDLTRMSAEQEAAYRSYPLKSLDMVLSRKLGLNEKMRDIVTSVRERADGKGFPKGIRENHLSAAAQLIGFCKLLDTKTIVRAGQLRPNPEDVKKELSSPDILFSGMLSPVLGKKLKDLLT